MASPFFLEKSTKANKRFELYTGQQVQVLLVLIHRHRFGEHNESKIRFDQCEQSLELCKFLVKNT